MHVLLSTEGWRDDVELRTEFALQVRDLAELPAWAGVPLVGMGAWR